jgi:hypothetical protein
MTLNLKRTWVGLFTLLTVILLPKSSRADFFGGDLPLLAEIVANTIQEISELQSVIGNGKDTLGFLHDINAGLQDALNLQRTLNSTFQQGVLGGISNPEQLLQTVRTIYGMVPSTQRTDMEQLHDQSVAESITLHNQAFDYADQVDPEAERIKDYSHDASPGGAAKLTAESIGVLITVADQILRTNAAILKINSEQLALQNEREKLGSQQFVSQYSDLSNSFDALQNLHDSVDLAQELTW